jgi:hypothetical protein
MLHIPVNMYSYRGWTRAGNLGRRKRQRDAERYTASIQAARWGVLGVKGLGVFWIS